jgi:crotonobetainyl-CoA:carnitine CoA-transferase CaiB-like acyl-CoA transferase
VSSRSRSATRISPPRLLNIAANKQEQFETLCGLLGREDLIAHPNFADRDERKKNRYALKAELEKALAAGSAKEWAVEMNARGIPAGAVLTVPEILADPQVTGRGMIATYKSVPGVARDVRVVRNVAKFNGEPLGVDAPPPTIGQHNAEVYGALGLSEDEQAALQEEGVI